MESAHLEFPSSDDCTAEVFLDLTRAPDFGRVVITLNNQFGGTFDGYASDVGREAFPLGRMSINRGQYRINITPVEKNEKTSGLNAGIDTIRWECQ